MLLIKGGGISTVFDIKTGEPLRGPKRIASASEYFASPIAGDGKIYVAGENGMITVLNDGPDYKVLATNDVGGSVVATPAIADGACSSARATSCSASRRGPTTNNRQPTGPRDTAAQVKNPSFGKTTRSSGTRPGQSQLHFQGAVPRALAPDAEGSSQGDHT